MLNFKKVIVTFVLAIALMQIFTVVPVHAQECDSTCWHIGCSNHSSSDDGYPCSNCTAFYENKVYESNGNGMSHSYKYECSGCGYNDSASNETCVIVNGACRECGQIKTDNVCAHQNCSNQTESLSVCSDCIGSNSEHTYVKVDDNVHDYVFICGKCGSEAGDNTRGVPHWDNGGGYCICGHDVSSASGSNGSSSESNYRLNIQGPERNYLVSYGNSVYEEFEQTKLVLTCPNGEVISYQIPVANGAWDIRSYLLNSGEYAITMYVGENVVATDTRYIYSQVSSGELESAGGSVSGNSVPKPVVPSAPAPTEAEIHAQKAAEVEAKQKKTVRTASGEAVKTEIPGVYEFTSLSGAAVSTSRADVKKAIGLSEEEIAAGTNASIFMTDFVSKEDREILTNAATNSGKTVLSMVVSDMYSITKDGKITRLHNSKEPVSIMFGIPKHAVDANRAYSVLCVTADGKVVELKDTDNDPSTITVDTTVFGKYVIVY